MPLEKYIDKRIIPIGVKHGIINKVKNINNNRKGNPEKELCLEGVWLNTLINKYHLEVTSLIICEEYIKTPEQYKLVQEISQHTKVVYTVSAKVFDRISEGANTCGIISIVKFPKPELSALKQKKANLILVLDGLEIPGNIGTIVRSCDGTQVDAIIITNRKTRLTHPKFIRSSQGACFSIPIYEMESQDAIDYFTSNDYRILITDTMSSNYYYDESYQGNVALIMGSERYGISESWYQENTSSIMIPMFGEMDSLNVGIASAIILYEATLKRNGMLKR